MGIVVSSSRNIQLTGLRHELEYKINLIHSAKMNLVQNINSLTASSTDLEADSPEVRLLEERKQRLMLLDKKLDIDLQHYQTQLKMIDGEDQQVSQTLSSSIQKAYR